MLKMLGVFVIGGLLGTGLGFAVGIFAYPYIFLTDIVGTEAPPAGVQTILARGEFIHADPSDPIHYGKGRMTVYENVLHLEADFEVGPGPKFHVYLVPSAVVTSEEQVEGAMFVDLGRLKAFKGSQNYAIPTGVELSDFGSVVVWCEQFGVLISPATLVFEG